MSSHDHHDNHSNEPKPVSFTVPFILASVLLVIIFMFLSLCDPKKHGECECAEDCSTECMEACEKGDHSKHPATMGHDEHNADAKTDHTEAKDTSAVETPHTSTDTIHKEAAHEAHH